MFRIADSAILNEFVEQELKDPCPRKESEGRTIYTSRSLRSRGITGPPVLCDFGAAVFANDENVACVQPHAYRAPEVTLRCHWDHKIDIRNVGCMVSCLIWSLCNDFDLMMQAWNLFEGDILFRGIDPEHLEYRRRAQLAEIVGPLGLPPRDLLSRGQLSSKLFSEEG